MTHLEPETPADLQPTCFRILGPLEVTSDEGAVPVPPGRQQVVLAALLLEYGRLVSNDYMVHAVWGVDPPKTARTQVQICVSRLRRVLVPTGATIETRPTGYVLRGPPGVLDADHYRDNVSIAAVLVQEGRDEEAAALLRSAVGLWRGPALSGVDSDVLRAKAAQLDEERLTSVEASMEIELRLGRHARLVGELAVLVQEHPLRERLRSLLMVALYRSGRQAEALSVYRVGRRLLVEELGLEPGEELRALERAILSGDPTLRAPEPPATARTHAGTGDPPPQRRPVATPGRSHAGSTSQLPGSAPFQLPTATADFVGRALTVRAVTEILGRTDTVGIAVLLGRPGVGKSATAVHVAHALADEHYPDGQLYCDLRATRENPLPAAEVLSRFLRALGVPADEMPADLDERAGMYRGLLASRRVLVVLDDAASESQVLPLVPGGAGCGVIVTSRARVTGLPGSAVVKVDVFSEPTSIELLAQVLGRHRVEAEPEAASALVEAVGRLPLALRIVAARLAARPHWTMSGMVERLADESQRLDQLSHGEMSVRAGLSLAYDALPACTARAFELLGLVQGSSIPAWVVGALLDDHRPCPSDLADPLVDAHLLDVVGQDPAGQPAYRFHDLVRAFSREQATGRLSGPTRRAALERMMGGWLALLEDANRRVVGADLLDGVAADDAPPRWNPPARYVDRLLADPCAWLEHERSNLRQAIVQCAEEGLVDQCWELVVRFTVFLERRGYRDMLAEMHDLAATVTAPSTAL